MLEMESVEDDGLDGSDEEIGEKDRRRFYSCRWKVEENSKRSESLRTARCSACDLDISGSSIRRTHKNRGRVLPRR